MGRPQWGCALASCAATKPTRKNRSACPDVLIPVAAQMFHSLTVRVECVKAPSQCWPGAATFKRDVSVKRNGGLTGSCCPAVKKKVMKATWIIDRRMSHNRRTWRRQSWVDRGIFSEREKKSTVKSRVCSAASDKQCACALASWVQSVHVTLWILAVFCCTLSSKTAKRNPGGAFP